jgi:hypothetical protein
MADEIIIETTSQEVVEIGVVGPQGPRGADGAGLTTLTTAGDLLYRNATEPTRLPVGSNGQVLKVSGGLPSWGNESGAVTSVNGNTGAVTVQPAQTISSPSITQDTVLTAGRNQLLYLTANGGTTANITLPYANNQNGDTITVSASFVGFSSSGALTIRSAGQMVGGTPQSYSNLRTLTESGQSVTLVSDGSNGFGGWTVVSLGRHVHSIADVTNLQTALDAKQAAGNYPFTDNAVQEYNVTGVLLPNGDSGSGVQLTRNTETPQAPDGSERTFNAEQLIYRRVSGTAQRLDTYLGVKLEWQPVAPTTKTSTGSTGQIAYADPYFYICVGVNTWRRVPVAAW